MTNSLLRLPDAATALGLRETFLVLGIALGLGLLVGLQRERSMSVLAGFRTFPLFTCLGALCALLAVQFGGWVVAWGFVAAAGLIVVGNLARMKTEEPDPGLTTEIALLVMYGVGAYLVIGHKAVALAVGGGVAVLLHLKPELHSLAARIGDRDFKAIMQFTLITLVILPVLPNAYYGPYQVLNPFRLWLMVVLIVGISLGGYLLYKWVGQNVGALMSGFLGGLISSTATTVSYARRSRETTGSHGMAAFVVTFASAIVFVRVLLVIGATAPDFLRHAGPPLGIMLGVLMVLSGVIWLSSRREPARMPKQENPTEFKSAILFGALYAIVLLAVAAAKQHVGSSGLYVVAVLSGLTDMDAITLSTNQLVSSGQLAPQTGWRMILVAAMSNLVFKGTVVALLGAPPLLARSVTAFGSAFATGAILLWIWGR